jgi:REP element-mobilizing transposase RayT
MTEGLHRFYSGNDLHFLTFSCYRRRPLLRNEAYCNLFLKILDRVRRRYRLVVLGYVVMPEHVHLLVSEPQRETLFQIDGSGDSVTFGQQMSATGPECSEPNSVTGQTRKTLGK